LLNYHTTVIHKRTFGIGLDKRSEYKLPINDSLSYSWGIRQQSLVITRLTQFLHLEKNNVYSFTRGFPIDPSVYSLFTLPEHLSLPSDFSGVRVTRSLVLCACFVDRCLSFRTFSFGHCVVCSSSIYGFWLPLWLLVSLNSYVVVDLYELFLTFTWLYMLAIIYFLFCFC
jgi:hypothetical protein